MCIRILGTKFPFANYFQEHANFIWVQYCHQKPIKQRVYFKHGERNLLVDDISYNKAPP